ncbi:hypothetical protein LSH36_498g00065 [Paralvinella palmiformis]|uniref:C2H2-type domain-containing protein n=1 Tax=Paralvinella palmiformis TaxID=53620 RepID=A0AAD9J9M4_9ANNE|nr:hypothetical protein LSH36_498g00065 [Paralvinella palmiformis]
MTTLKLAALHDKSVMAETPENGEIFSVGASEQDSRVVNFALPSIPYLNSDVVKASITKEEACYGLLAAVRYLQTCCATTDKYVKLLVIVLRFIENLKPFENLAIESPSGVDLNKYVLNDDTDTSGLLQNLGAMPEEEISTDKSNEFCLTDDTDKVMKSSEYLKMNMSTSRENDNSPTNISSRQTDDEKHLSSRDMKMESAAWNKDDELQSLVLPDCFVLKKSTVSPGKDGLFTKDAIGEEFCFGPCPAGVMRNFILYDLSTIRMVPNIRLFDGCTSQQEISGLRWMTVIQCSNEISGQNLRLVKYKEHFYYQTTRMLLTDTELILGIPLLQQTSCEKFGKGEYLRKHKMLVEGSECHQCGKHFKSHSTLYYHRKVHSGIKEFQCPVCLKLFTLHGSLKNHLLIHSEEKPYTCDVCGKSFAQLGNLQSHQRTHTGEKPYACVVCEQRFAHQSTLRAHMCRHTGERRFQCPTCGKRFYRSDVLKIHINTHGGEKKHKCDVCGKAFSHPGYVQIHKTMHNNNKPHLCGICGERFTRAQSMKRHIDCIHLKLGGVHTCLDCGRQFKRQYHLVRHITLFTRTWKS